MSVFGIFKSLIWRYRKYDVASTSLNTTRSEALRTPFVGILRGGTDQNSEAKLSRACVRLGGAGRLRCIVRGPPPPCAAACAGLPPSPPPRCNRRFRRDHCDAMQVQSRAAVAMIKAPRACGRDGKAAGLRLAGILCCRSLWQPPATLCGSPGCRFRLQPLSSLCCGGIVC